MKLLLKGGPLDGQVMSSRKGFDGSLPLEHARDNEVGHYDINGRWIVERDLKPQVELSL